jgi:cell division protein FtsA
MEKPIAVIEFTSRSIRLVVGFVIDEEVYVLYALDKPIGRLIQNGEITSVKALNEEVKTIASVSDSSAKLKIKITNAVLGLPPLGLEIFQTKQITNAVSEEGKIENIDIKNLNNIIYKEKIPHNNSLVGIIPEQFILDQDRIFKNAPVGEISNTITVLAKVHTLPKHIVEDYKTSLIDGGISLKRTFVSPFGVAELLANYKNVPADYILVDIGARITTVSLVGKKQLYGSTYFMWGGDYITDKIAREFNIDETDAEKYKIMYGYDRREMNFKAPVCTSEDENGLPIKHSVEEMNIIVKSELDHFVKKLNIAIDELLKDYESSYKTLPMIVIGGGSQLHGLKEYMEPKVQSKTVDMIVPKTIGTRNPSFFTCLGLIKANSKYPNIIDDGHLHISKVTRNSPSEE